MKFIFPVLAVAAMLCGATTVQAAGSFDTAPGFGGGAGGAGSGILGGSDPTSGLVGSATDSATSGGMGSASGAATPGSTGTPIAQPTLTFSGAPGTSGGFTAGQTPSTSGGFIAGQSQGVAPSGTGSPTYDPEGALPSVGDTGTGAMPSTGE
jgi:hypothetical protein